MTRREKYKNILLVTLIISFLGVLCMTLILIRNSIPNKIRLIAGEEQSFEFDFPTKSVVYQETKEVGLRGKSDIPQDNLHVSSSMPFTILANQTGNYTVSCKLFGFIQLKNMKVDVVEEKQYLTPSGIPVGIYLETDGILAIGTGSVVDQNGESKEPAHHIIQSGDYILAVNQEKVSTKQDLIDKINLHGKEEIILDVRRKEEIIQLSMKAVMTGDEEYKLGIWVRDNTQGIGTLTFVDQEGDFGALGHGINDVDTSELMTLKTGKLYNAQIVDIVKGEKGSPGELSGIIQYSDDNIIGEVKSNTKNGIYGTMKDGVIQSNVPMEICYKQDVKLGPATILSPVTGSIEEYEVEIKEVHLNDNEANKGIVLEVTDPKLLELTGGIVQGMSGSPIIQDGKLVGAVTHVFIQDSTSGFGIFIENMIES